MIHYFSSIKELTSRFKDILLALSLANLCFIKVWTGLIGSATDTRGRFEVYNIENFAGIMINVVVLAFLLWTANRVAMHIGNSIVIKLARIVFVISLLVPLNSFISTQTPDFSLTLLPEYLSKSDALILLPLGLIFIFSAIMQWRHATIGAAAAVPLLLIGRTSLAIILLDLAVLIAIALIFWYSKQTVKIACTALLILSPLVLINFSQALWMMSHTASIARPKPFEGNSEKRLLWIVFDEMDQNLCFDNRPDSVKLVEIDRLRDQAIYASRAYPPSDYTLLSLPSLITGRFVSSCEPVTPSRMMLTFESSRDKVDWRSQPNIFSNARQLGINTAMIGWYHPYDRILSDNLTTCAYHYLSNRSLFDCMQEQMLDMTQAIPFVSHFNLFNVTEKKRHLRRKYHKSDYTKIMEDAKLVASDPGLGLIFLHFPIPHLPGIYDRQTDELTVESGKSYLDNLELADRTIGELRRSMEEAGIWEDTTVLVTSDHWWRADQWCCIKNHTQHAWTTEDGETFEKHLSGKVDGRVPFLLKLAGQKQRAIYENDFNTVLTHDLFLALLRGEISDQKSVIDWIDSYRSIGKSPYLFGHLR